MNILESIKERVVKSSYPKSLKVSPEEYNALIEAIPSHLRFSRNGSENVIFPVFSNTVIYHD